LVTLSQNFRVFPLE